MIRWNATFGWGLGCVLAWTHFLKGKWRAEMKKTPSPDLPSPISLFRSDRGVQAFKIVSQFSKKYDTLTAMSKKG